ncbi:protein of unknown function [Candidatus Methylocalor cossyra]|uniref:Uncharacterized protein n=1 Tax=Candidatus Methylocalor cossyra TaxID=3108543 RepID=A0ABM9NG12_9GAMM
MHIQRSNLINLNGYPGHNCPGLIEALKSRHDCKLCRPVIRGITAPASLKLIMGKGQ